MHDREGEFSLEESEEDNIMDAVDGYFFLQKTDEKSYLARFRFQAKDVYHYADDY